MNFINTLKIIAQMLPVIIEMIKAVEQALPESGKGKEKLEFVREMLENIYSTTDNFGVAFVEVWPKLKPVIDSVVKLLNATGVFKKGQ